MLGKKGTVCVTGGTGFVASWLVMKLLDDGYYVRTTVRSDSEHRKELSFLTSLPGASERLEIFNADLKEPESFRATIKGCVGVFHVATPVDFEGKEPEEVVTKRSIDGAISILRACQDSKTVKKVVYTSSASAVVFNGKDLNEMDESFWSDIDYIKTLESNAKSYMISKTLTERAVLEFSEKHGLEIVTLLPSFVCGPFICPKLPSSVLYAVHKVLGNKDDGPDFRTHLDIVHVDDAARAHIFLFENPEAKGRYNCSSNSPTIESVAKFLSTKYPELQMPITDYFKEPIAVLPSLSSKKLTDSGFVFEHGVEDIFYDAIKCCKEKGYF